MWTNVIRTSGVLFVVVVVGVMINMVMPGVDASNTYETLDGQVVTLDSYVGQGNVVVANTWATWCPFCVEELPDFERLAKDYPDVTVLLINRQESKDEIIDFLEEVNVSADIPNLIVLLDLSDSFYTSITSIAAMPQTLFYTVDGAANFHKRGFMRYEEMAELTADAVEASIIHINSEAI